MCFRDSNTIHFNPLKSEGVGIFERDLSSELDGSVSERVTRISACFGKAGFNASVLENIRSEIRLQLWAT